MASNSRPKPVIQLDHVAKSFPVTRGLILKKQVGRVRAVDDISFEILEGETFSLVGETGCGKTTTARLILRIETPTAGRVLWEGADVHQLSGSRLKDFRTSVQAVFQDPWSSLNPRMRVGSIIMEPLIYHRRLSRAEAKAQLETLMQDVGLHPHQADHFPHEFSGGQRQRIAIARALSLRPQVIVLDEPVSSLDVSIRAQIMNLLRNLQKRFGLSYLLIAHSLATARHMSNQVAVMYLGKIVERAPSRDLFDDPMHPYTQALIASSLPLRPDSSHPEPPVVGEVPSPIDPPAGCSFHPRCPFAMERCRQETPELRELKPGHWVACHLY